MCRHRPADRAICVSLLYWCLLLCCLVIPRLVTAQLPEVTRKIPMPVAEAGQVITAWLTGAGLQVEEARGAGGALRIAAHGADSSWDIVLVPDTPLACVARIRYSGQEQDPAGVLDQAIRSRLDHREGAAAGQEAAFPSPVLERIEAIVCIRALSRGHFFQSSGFFIDSDGLVLCTAHDLREHEEVRVTTATGLEFKGDVLRADFARDLALIRIKARMDRVVDVTGGRNLLGMGEQVYAVGCPVNLRGTVNSGILNAPPRRVGKLPYWQVSMEIRPGSSGSAVFDARGRFVGMVKGRYRGTDSIGFLIPLETIVEFLKEQL